MLGNRLETSEEGGFSSSEELHTGGSQQGLPDQHGTVQGLPCSIGAAGVQCRAVIEAPLVFRPPLQNQLRRRLSGLSLATVGDATHYCVQCAFRTEPDRVLPSSSFQQDGPCDACAAIQILQRAPEISDGTIPTYLGSLLSAPCGAEELIFRHSFDPLKIVVEICIIQYSRLHQQRWHPIIDGTFLFRRRC
ncbi:hypothetical protein VTN02DRAFT_4637 [Thermoascus thermophilus]